MRLREASNTPRRAWALSLVLLGPRVLRAQALAGLGVLALGAMDWLLALLLQLFLQTLDVLAPDLSAPRWLHAALPTLAHVALAMLTIGLIRAVAHMLVAQAAVVTLEGCQHRLRALAVYELLLHPAQPYVPLSRLTLQLAEHFTKSSYFAYAAAGLLSDALQALVLLVVLACTAAKETAVALIGVALTGVLVRALQKKSARAAAQVPEELDEVTRGLERIARNLMLVRALRTERREHARFRHNIDAYHEHATAAGVWGALAGAAAPLLGLCLVVLTVILSQRVLHTSGLVLLSFLYLLVRFVQALSSAVGQLSTAVQYWPQFRASRDYLEELGVDSMQLALADTVAAASAHEERAAERAPSVQFAGVSFRYADSWVLEDLDLQLAPGAQLAVVGPSGSGKSTLLALVLGLLEPTRGQVTLDGKSPSDYFRGGHRVGYVGAEAYLIAGTLADNLCYGLTHTPSDAELWHALGQARLESVVRALPDGLAHRIREDGAGLSAGEKQRLALARALLAKPGLLVLDEASANLDEATEAELTESLRALRGTVTVLVVSHRPQLLAHADQRLELKR